MYQVLFLSQQNHLWKFHRMFKPEFGENTGQKPGCEMVLIVQMWANIS